jgi:Flp pilus assembly secretin CpaC
MRANTFLAALALLGVIGCRDATQRTLAFRDEKITADVEASLKANVPGEIQVSTRDGVVTLSGTVPDGVSRQKAGELANRSGGVKQVNNNLRTTLAADAPAVAPPANIPPAAGPPAVNLPPAPELK